MVTTYRTARQAGIERLYHYEKFIPNYLSDILRHKRIHCSLPGNLNDPWDCRPWFHGVPIEDPDEFNELRDFLYQIREPPEHLKAKLEARLKDHRFAEMMNGLSKRLGDEIQKRGIYCLTSDPESNLMWSHYGDHHRGICLEFGVDNPLFDRAFEVTYLSEYPIYRPHRVMTEQGTLALLLTKSEDWKYEKEFRIIVPKDAPDSSPLKAHNQFLTLPPGSLKSIIAGCQASYEDIKRLVKSRAPDLPVKLAIRVPNRYRLQVEE